MLTFRGRLVSEIQKAAERDMEKMFMWDMACHLSRVFELPLSNLQIVTLVSLESTVWVVCGINAVVVGVVYGFG